MNSSCNTGITPQSSYSPSYPCHILFNPPQHHIPVHRPLPLRPLGASSFPTDIDLDDDTATPTAGTHLSNSIYDADADSESSSHSGCDMDVCATHIQTPRAQRTSTDSQTWEFSHLKFLRGRPDLLDEIKRKALEPDPAVKHRVELPGEVSHQVIPLYLHRDLISRIASFQVAAQLGAMRDENRRVWEQVNIERRRADKLVNVVAQLWDVVGKGFAGGCEYYSRDEVEASFGFCHQCLTIRYLTISL